MRSQVIKAATVVVALVAVLAACGSDNKKTEATTPTTPSTQATTTTTSPPSPYKATATPTDVKDGTLVNVTVSGFKAGLTLGINECAQKGDAEVGAADCALDAIKTLKVAADGTGSGSINVKIRGIGTNAHDCTQADTRCFLSIGELSADPNAQRSDDIDLHFTA